MGCDMISIIDYGAGNLSSVAKAVSRLGYRCKVTSSPKDILRAEAVVLPGVGAAADAIARLHSLNLIEAISRVVNENRPFFGICLGLQILFDTTEEGKAKCLGLMRGMVIRLPRTLKVPHMGWNQVRQKAAHPVFAGIPDGSNFYFVHSYYPDVADKSLVIGETEHGITFCSIMSRGNLVATQFPPEKSGDLGLTMLRNFFRFTGVKG